MTDSKILWKFIHNRWTRWVIFRHALGFGLIMGIGIPLMNTILPSPNYDLATRLQFSVPFFVISWGCYGAYSWHKNEKKAHKIDNNIRRDSQ